MKRINNFNQWTNGSVDMTFTRGITHQKHLAQSGRSTRREVDIFNTLRVFTKEPIRQQEIKLECMNNRQTTITRVANESNFRDANGRVITPQGVWSIILYNINECALHSRSLSIVNSDWLEHQPCRVVEQGNNHVILHNFTW